jgi:hypothetical protein
MNDNKANLTKTGKFIARKFLKHHNKDAANFNQDLIIDSLGQHMDQIQKTTQWGGAIVLILIWSIISDNKNVPVNGLNIPINQTIYFASVFFIFIHISLTICYTRIGKLILLLDDRKNFIKGLSKLSTHTLIFNPFAFLGSKNYSHIWVDINIWGSLISLVLLSLLAIFTGGEKPVLLFICGLFMLPQAAVILEILDIISSKLDKKNKNLLNMC